MFQTLRPTWLRMHPTPLCCLMMEDSLKIFWADFHVHTVLSPCTELDMTPRSVMEQARLQGLHIIGISDHNSTRQCEEMKRIGTREGLFVLCGAEVTTKEEVHCLTFFETPRQLAQFQAFLDRYLPPIPNVPERFGYQLVVDANEKIIFEEPHLLSSAIDRSINEVEEEVHRLDGIFIPAHVDKPRNSLISQLGFVPPDLRVEALELTRHTRTEDFLRQHPELAQYAFTHASDAHFVADIGCSKTALHMQELNFQSIKNALQYGHLV
jgi:PHP family Zn ribbon phosphoesterase